MIDSPQDLTEMPRDEIGKISNLFLQSRSRTKNNVLHLTPDRTYLNLSSRALEEDDSTRLRAKHKLKSTAAAVLLGILEMPAQKS
jgi:hypothetical protein